MSEDETAALAVTGLVTRALEHVATLYEARVHECDDYDSKLTDDGVRLATALDKLQKTRIEIASREAHVGEGEDDMTLRDLVRKLEIEIEATVAERVAAFADGVPAQCPKCSFQLPKLAPSEQPAAANRT